MRTARWLCLVFCLMLSLSCLAEPQAPTNGAKAAILIDCASGRTLYEKNADAQLPIASVTKIMTCLLALENCALDEIVTASARASGVPGTSIYLSAGEALTMEQMLYGLMLRSGNDAAVAVAEHVAGDEHAFGDMMNARAEALGAHAYFTTPNGLDEGGNGASARGVALIAREAMRSPQFREIVSTQRQTIPWIEHQYARVLTNKNKLLANYAGALGIKTGFTSKAGRCLAFAAEREGLTLIGVVLNCPAWFDDARALLDWGFENYEMRTVLAAGDIAARVPVIEGERPTVALSVLEPLAFALKAGEEYSLEFVYDDIRAPVAAGARLGTVYAWVGGDIVCERALIATEDVRAVRWADAFKRVMSCWPIFKINRY